MRGEIADVMRDIFNSPTLEIAQAMKRKAIDNYQKRAPEFAKWLEENVDEGLTVYQYPREHWKKIRTSNGMERVNREIKKRTKVAVLFPNKESALRILRARMLAAAQEEAERIAAAERKNQVRTVDRSERIRTYNFPENRLSDHRVNYKANNLDAVMNGDLEAVIQSLIDADRTAKLTAGNS